MSNTNAMVVTDETKKLLRAISLGLTLLQLEVIELFMEKVGFTFEHANKFVLTIKPENLLTAKLTMQILQRPTIGPDDFNHPHGI